MFKKTSELYATSPNWGFPLSGTALSSIFSTAKGIITDKVKDIPEVFKKISTSDISNGVGTVLSAISNTTSIFEAGHITLDYLKKSVLISDEDKDYITGMRVLGASAIVLTSFVIVPMIVQTSNVLGVLALGYLVTTGFSKLSELQKGMEDNYEKGKVRCFIKNIGETVNNILRGGREPDSIDLLPV